MPEDETSLSILAHARLRNTLEYSAAQEYDSSAGHHTSLNVVRKVFGGEPIYRPQTHPQTLTISCTAKAV
jgi:hypothetical protein